MGAVLVLQADLLVSAHCSLFALAAFCRALFV